MRKLNLVRVILPILAAVSFVISFAAPALANDGSGYRWGNDTSCPTNTSGSLPYTNVYSPSPCSGPPSSENFGGHDGGYLTQIGGWYDETGCGGGGIDNSTDYNRAYTQKWNYGIGTGPAEYWMLGGPGRDPSFSYSSYTTTDAYNWGHKQGEAAINDYLNYSKVLSPVIWMDMEWGDGFNNVYSGCGNYVTASGIATSLDRHVFNGFFDAIKNQGLNPGVYSDTSYWSLTFLCGECSSGDGHIPHTYEWTFGSTKSGSPCPSSGSCYSAVNLSIKPVPTNFCNGNGYCAQFFGGQTRSSSYAVMWQWSTWGQPSGSCGNYGKNCFGDFDQINESRIPGGT